MAPGDGGPLALPVAAASVVRPQSFENLIDRSQLVVIGQAAERTCVWEDGRIITYSRVAIEQTVVGTAPQVLWIRTLGGEVGELGQSVDGEASLELGRATLLFLEPAPGGTFAVAARAQGQFFIDARPSGRILRPHPAMGAFMVRGPRDLVVPAADRLKTRFVDDAARDIRARWEANHARK